MWPTEWSTIFQIVRMSRRIAASQLDRQGFVGRPEWHSLRMGVPPQGIFQAEPG